MNTTIKHKDVKDNQGIDTSPVTWKLSSSRKEIKSAGSTPRSCTTLIKHAFTREEYELLEENKW